MVRRWWPVASMVPLALVVIAALATPLWAAVFGGTLKTVNPKAKSIVIEPKSGGTKTFSVPDSAEVQIDGKKSTLDKLGPGQTVSVTTSKSGTVTKVSARGEAVAKPADDSSDTKPASTPDPDKPEPKKPNTVASAPKPSTGRRPAATAAASGEWNQYGGPNRDNQSPETGLLDSWDGGGPELVWTGTGLGQGYSSVSISDGVIYTMGTEGSNEVVFALSADSGKEIWTARTGGGVFNDGNGNGPRGTPTVDGDFIYALGAHGDLVCLAKDGGRVVWSKNILREYQGNNITWGICESPLVDGNQVVVTPGGRRGTMVALNKNNGNELWTCVAPGNPATAYSSAIIVETGGIRQYVNFTQNSIIGVQSNGTLLWGDDHSANGTANCSSPVAFRDMVFAASGYGKGGAMVRLSKSGRGVTANFAYHSTDMKNHHGGMVALDGYVYGANDNIMACLDMKDGKLAWRDRSPGKCSVVYADGHLYCRNEGGGEMTLVEATPSAYKEKGKFQPPQRSGRPAWAHPVVAAGKLLIRDQDKLLAFNVKK